MERRHHLLFWSLFLFVLRSASAAVFLDPNPNGKSILGWVFLSTTAVINGASYKWINGQMDNSFGNRSGQNDHTGDDYYAQDWNLTSGGNTDKSQDLFSGMSGTVIFADNTRSQYSGTVNYGNQVVVLNGQFALRYTHLDTVTVSTGDTVQVGLTRIGTLGCSGLPSSTNQCSISNPDKSGLNAHLHLVLYRSILPNSTALNNLSKGNLPSGRLGPENGTEFSADFDLDPSMLPQALNDHSLIRRDKGEQTVYWYQNLKKYRIDAFDAITSAMKGTDGWGTSSTSSIAAETVNGIIEGPAFIKLGSASDRNQSDGLLLRQLKTEPIYLVENGARRWIKSQEALDWINGDHNFPNVIDVASSIFSDYVPVLVQREMECGLIF